MKRIIFSLLGVALLVGRAGGAVVVFGDSWGVPAAPALQQVFNDHGYTEEIVCGAARGGSVAAPTGYSDEKSLSSAVGLQYITDTLLYYSDANLVHLSIGGNDFLGNWNSGLSPAEEEAVFNTIVGYVETILSHILSVRPEAEVFWSSYDYIRPWYSGTPAQINAAFNTVSGKAQELADDMGSNVTYHDFAGLMQVTYGFDGVQWTEYDPDFYIPPGSPLLPDPNYPSPIESFNDPIHLTPEGYSILAEQQYNVFYGPRLVTELVAGDTNFDNDVDFGDFTTLASNYTGTSGNGKSWYHGDFDGDGDVDFGDFTDLASHYTGSLDGGKPVPEPSTLTLLSMGAVGLLAYALRRRKRAA